MRLSLTCLVAIVLAVVPAASAQAPSSWSAPALVAPPSVGTFFAATAFAIGAGGRGMALWDYRVGNAGHTGQRAAERRPDGSFGKVHELQTSIDPPVLYGRDRAVAVVRAGGQARRVRVVLGSTRGRFGAERTIYSGEPV